MNIAVVGLGLIGGSLCKAIKHRTKHLCFGLDKSGETLHAALNQGAIDRVIEPEAFCSDGTRPFTPSSSSLHPHRL